jgi:outer membrane protein
MKPRIVALLLAALATFTFATARAEVRIAYIDMQRALEEIEEGKTAKARLKKQFEEKQRQLDTKQEELKRDNANLESLAREGVLKEDKLREKKMELERKLMEVTKYWQDAQKTLSEEERRLTQEIFAKMSGVIRGIAEIEGFTYVLDRSAGLLYAPDSLDVTNELIRKYNARFGASGTGKAAPPAKDSKPAGKK